MVPIEGNRKKLNGPDPDCACVLLLAASADSARRTVRPIITADRYMMPPVITSTTSKHLVVDNMREVAKALEVEPTWIAKVCD